MSPRGYWKYIHSIVTSRNKAEAKEFCQIMLRFCACPTSNAAVERKFSAASLDQTKLRNRLKAETMEKLLRVSSLKEGESSGDEEY